jgi:predicted dehydrogenase
MTQPTRSTIGAAVVGTGFIGRVHARSVHLAGGRLVGVAGRTPERARDAAVAFGAERAFASYDELLAAPDVDVVHVCTPNAMHEPLAAAALAAGRHVVCEKPLALDAAGAERLTVAAAGRGTLAAVPFVYRFHPMVREARERIANGELGAVRLVHGSYQQDWLADANDWNWRVDPAEGGASRAFADIGSHWCDLVEFVSGQRITRLVARTLTAVPERVDHGSSHAFATTQDGPGERRAVTTEDAAVVLFETDAGAAGSVVVSQLSPGRKNRLWFEVVGEHAGVAFDQEQSESLWLGRRDAVSLLARDPAHLSKQAARLSPMPAGHAQGYQECFEHFVADVYDVIAGGAREGLPVFADGLRAARITGAVLASSRTDSWVEVPR